MDLALLKEGVVITVLGMGTVFLFLTLMIFAMRINEFVLKFVNKFCPEEIPEVKTVQKKTNNKDDEIAVAIACAIKQRAKS